VEAEGYGDGGRRRGEHCRGRGLADGIRSSAVGGHPAAILRHWLLFCLRRSFPIETLGLEARYKLARGSCGTARFPFCLSSPPPPPPHLSIPIAGFGCLGVRSGGGDHALRGLAPKSCGRYDVGGGGAAAHAQAPHGRAGGGGDAAPRRSTGRPTGSPISDAELLPCVQRFLCSAYLKSPK
jgi:hypothetical protein